MDWKEHLISAFNLSPSYIKLGVLIYLLLITVDGALKIVIDILKAIDWLVIKRG